MSDFTEKKRNAASKDQCGYCGEPALLFNSFGNYRGFGKRSLKDRPVNCGKSAPLLAYSVGVFLPRPQLSVATATSFDYVSTWTMRPAPRCTSRYAVTWAAGQAARSRTN